jgi:hypothetical protein
MSTRTEADRPAVSLADIVYVFGGTLAGIGCEIEKDPSAPARSVVSVRLMNPRLPVSVTVEFGVKPEPAAVAVVPAFIRPGLMLSCGAAGS